MKYVALLSGGKDSCFNLLHCKKNGHKLVAAATLSPESGKDEIDSYLYQTVGQDGIALIARALQVPLYRHIIHGRPLNQGAEYGTKAPGGGGTTGDETEDLHALLSTVLEHHPDIQGVAVGAILSNYQRVRVEHVCRRLSLTPLAYLWQRNQTALLSDMLSAGLNAILIKVAGAGLTPSHLGITLSKMYPTLLRLHAIYGTHPCGEGGEYESFTLDCPGMFKGVVMLQDTEKVGDTAEDIAPVAYLRIKSATVEDKRDEQLSAEETQGDVPVPPLLEPSFRNVRICVGPLAQEYARLPPSVRTVGGWIAVGNVSLPPETETQSVGEQVTRCFDILKELLAPHVRSSASDTLASAAMITLLIPSLDPTTFGAANSAYSAFFGASPPARACIGAGKVVMLDCVARTSVASMENTSEVNVGDSQGVPRRSLHVQSLSYWAPANIGPYSQAISISPWTFISGQIGLLPASLTLPVSSHIPAPYPSTADDDVSGDTHAYSRESSLPLETSLVLQHTARVIRAAPDARGYDEARGFGGSDGVEVDTDAESQGGHIYLALYYLVDMQDLKHVCKGVVATDEPPTPSLFAAVRSLPRGARLEKVVIVHSGLFSQLGPDLVDSNGEGHITLQRTPQFEQGDITLPGQEEQLALHWEVSHFLPSNEACAAMFARRLCGPSATEDIAGHLRAIPALAPFSKRTLTAKVFVSPSHQEPEKFLSLLTSFFGDEMPAVTMVPSMYVASRDERSWDWAVALMAV